MSDTLANLGRKIRGAGDLQSVVRTMKALAAASIGQYERSVRALVDYDRTVDLGLAACLRESQPTVGIEAAAKAPGDDRVGAIVLGSDQGLVGQFNESIVQHAIRVLAEATDKPQVWAVGDRVHARLEDSGLSPIGLYAVPTSVQGIASLVGRIQVESEAHRAKNGYTSLYVFHHRPAPGTGCEPVSLRLLPLDAQWQQALAQIRWPTGRRPQILGEGTGTFRTLLREHLFIALFRACAESLASENATRLAAMERADKNIDELLERLHATFHRLRQGGIDEELFDVISGFEALVPLPGPGARPSATVVRSNRPGRPS